MGRTGTTIGDKLLTSNNDFRTAYATDGAQVHKAVHELNNEYKTNYDEKILLTI